MSAIDSTKENTIYLALELSCSTWLAAMRLPGVDKIVLHRLTAGDTAALLAFVATQRARTETRLGTMVEVVSCFEAGRDGFWLHRFLLAMKALLATQGIQKRPSLRSWNRDLAKLRTADGRDLPPHLRAELGRLKRRLVLTKELIREIEPSIEEADPWLQGPCRRQQGHQLDRPGRSHDRQHP